MIESKQDVCKCGHDLHDGERCRTAISILPMKQCLCTHSQPAAVPESQPSAAEPLLETPSLILCEGFSETSRRYHAEHYDKSDVDDILMEAERQLREALTMLKEKDAEIVRLRESKDFSDAWRATRWERMWHWAHENLTEQQKGEFFSIAANGTKDGAECPTYAQQLNRAKHRAEAAEVELAKWKASHQALLEAAMDVEISYRHEEHNRSDDALWREIREAISHAISLVSA